MGKVSIGLRGWRFDEGAVFDDDGGIKPLEEMPPDARQRVVRLQALMGEPCDACYLIHREPDIEQCNVGEVVYGEPLGEVLLCDVHERDFRYWFREKGGTDLAGQRELQNAFHEWFADGGRAPEGYEPVEHVDEDPDELPQPDRPDRPDSGTGREGRPGTADGPDDADALGDSDGPDDAGALDVDLDDLDID